MSAVERRYVELRQEGGRRLSGVAVSYGDLAAVPFGRERIEPGAFTPIGDVILNAGHDRQAPLARTGGGGLELVDTERELIVRATLPETRAADDVLELVRAGVLRGLSVEMRPVSVRMEGGLRIIERAKLVGVAVVDTPAYPASEVEARRRGGRPNPWLRAQWQARKAGACDCQGPEIKSVNFEPGAWRDTLAEDREVLAVAGDYSRAVASRKRGTLELSEREDGGLDIRLTREAGDTPAGRDIAEMATAVPITARPILDNDLSTFTDENGERRFTKAHLRAVLLKPTERDDGWEPATFEDGERAKPEPAKRRAQVWL